VTFATSTGVSLRYAVGPRRDSYVRWLPGKTPYPTIIEKVCPQCGHLIELFSIDTQMPCENCGFVTYNDTLSCVQWCQYARKCVGDEMYEHMMEIAAMQKTRK
jgi:hypothetical protein